MHQVSTAGTRPGPATGGAIVELCQVEVQVGVVVDDGRAGGIGSESFGGAGQAICSLVVIVGRWASRSYASTTGVCW